MRSDASTVDEYVESLPEDRRGEIEAVRRVILEHLPQGYEEGMDFGMISYHVPLERYPETYNDHPIGLAALASQKRYISLYMLGVYAEPGSEERMREAFEREGKTLSMGKSCVRFASADDLALDAVGEAIASMPVDELIRRYEDSRRG